MDENCIELCEAVQNNNLPFSNNSRIAGCNGASAGGFSTSVLINYFNNNLNVEADITNVNWGDVNWNDFFANIDWDQVNWTDFFSSVDWSLVDWAEFFSNVDWSTVNWNDFFDNVDWTVIDWTNFFDAIDWSLANWDEFVTAIINGWTSVEWASFTDEFINNITPEQVCNLLGAKVDPNNPPADGDTLIWNSTTNEFEIGTPSTGGTNIESFVDISGGSGLYVGGLSCVGSGVITDGCMFMPTSNSTGSFSFITKVFNDPVTGQPIDTVFGGNQGFCSGVFEDNGLLYVFVETSDPNATTIKEVQVYNTSGALQNTINTIGVNPGSNLDTIDDYDHAYFCGGKVYLQDFTSGPQETFYEYDINGSTLDYTGNTFQIQIDSGEINTIFCDGTNICWQESLTTFGLRCYNASTGVLVANNVGWPGAGGFGEWHEGNLGPNPQLCFYQTCPDGSQLYGILSGDIDQDGAPFIANNSHWLYLQKYS